MISNNPPTALSRRQVVGAATAAGLTAALLRSGHVSGLGPDAEGGPMGGADAEFGRPDDVERAPTAPGVSYVSLAGASFFLVAGVGGKNSSSGEMDSTTTAFASAPIFLPNGSRVTELVSYVRRPNASSTRISLVAHRSSEGTTSAFVRVADHYTTAVPVGSSIQTLITPIAASSPGTIVDTSDAAYFVLVNPPADASHELWGVRIGYVAPGAGVYYPIDPIRAFDSRLPAYIASGRFLPNSSRIIALKDADDAAGAVTTPNVVPVGATAVTCNLTVTGTDGPNFLAMTPGDATAFTTSAINWSGPNVSIANGLTTKIDGNRTVKVWGGDQTGSTHAIIDVNGYYAAP